MHVHMQLKARLQKPGKPDQPKCIHCARQRRDYALLTVQASLKQGTLVELRRTVPIKLNDPSSTDEQEGDTCSPAWFKGGQERVMSGR